MTVFNDPISAAFEAGRRLGAQEERDQQRIRGDLCRWCHRQPEPQLAEQHGIGAEPVCLDEDGQQLDFGYGYDMSKSPY